MDLHIIILGPQEERLTAAEGQVSEIPNSVPKVEMVHFVHLLRAYYIKIVE